MLKVLLLFIPMLAGFVRGLLSSQLQIEMSTWANSTSSPEKVIRAERFELIDANGKVKAVLGWVQAKFSSVSDSATPAERSYLPGLYVFDNTGRHRIAIALDGVNNDIPRIDLFGSEEEEKNRIHIGTDSITGPSFSLFKDKNVSFGVNANGSGFSLILNDDPHGWISLSTGMAGPSINLHDDPHGGISLSPGIAGSSIFSSSNQNPRDYFSLKTGVIGPELSLRSDMSNASLSLSAGAGGPRGSMMRGQQVLWSAPFSGH